MKYTYEVCGGSWSCNFSLKFYMYLSALLARHVVGCIKYQHRKWLRLYSLVIYCVDGKFLSKTSFLKDDNLREQQSWSGASTPRNYVKSKSTLNDPP